CRSWSHKLHGHETTASSARPDAAGDPATRARRCGDPLPARGGDRGGGSVRARVRGPAPTGGANRPASQRAPEVHAVFARPLRDACKVAGWRASRTFWQLEVPAAAQGLVWNGMLSMAGGWFFLMVNEAFRLGDRDFRLPGVGSYMSVALDQGNGPAMALAILAMVAMIVCVDQLLW